MISPNTYMLIPEKAPAASQCSHWNRVAAMLGFGNGPVLDWRRAG
jgi:hypothetical protein